MRRIFAQVQKELTQIVRDRRVLALALILPMIQVVLNGTATALTVHNLPIIVQDFDDSSASRQLIDAFRGSLTFHIVPWSTDEQPDKAFTDGKARAALIIPSRFGRDIARGTNAAVQILVDGSDSNTAKLIAGYASQATSGFNQSTTNAPPQPVQSKIRFWYNPSRSSQKFYGPGFFVLAISMFPPLLAALAMAKEGEQKTILQVYVSNISAHELLIGKILAYMILGLCECAVLLTLLFTYYGIRFVGDPTPFVVSTFLYLFCVVTFGTMVGAAVRNQAAAMQAVLLGGFLLVFLLSGLLYPLENVPVGIRWLSNFVWARYYIEIVRDAMLQGGGWRVSWYKVLIIGAIGSVFYTIAWRNMRHMRLKA